MKPAARYVMVAAAALAGLFLWGWLRMGTAGELLPETGAYGGKPAETEAAYPAGEERFPDEGGASLKYDASRYLRSSPLADPFRMSGAASLQIKEAAAGEASALAMKSAPKETISLKGILSLGRERRAVLQSGSVSNTVREGDQFGSWTIGRIGRTEVTLYGPAGERTIPLAR